MKQTKLPRSDGRFLAFASLLAALLLGGGLWWDHFNATPRVTIPDSPLPSPNAYDYYAQAFRFHVERPLTLYDGYNSETGKINSAHKTVAQSLPFYSKPELRDWLAQNQKALQSLRQGFQYQYRQPAKRTKKSREELDAYFTTARGMSRTLNTEGCIRAAQGDWSGFTHSALDSIQLGHDLAHGAALDGFRCGSVVQNSGHRSLELLLPFLDAATCRKTERRIEQLNQTRVPFYDVLTEEKWAMQALLLELMRQDDWPEQSTNLLGRWFPAGRRLFNKKQLMNDYTTRMDSFIAFSRQPYVQSSLSKTPAIESMFPATNAYAYSYYDDIRDSAYDALLRVALTLQAYKFERKSYPAKLDDLVPAYLQSIPGDPFGGGKPLRYKKTGDTYLLWSVGPDKTDDGGKAAVWLTAKTDFARRLIKRESRGDFLFGVNH